MSYKVNFLHPGYIKEKAWGFIDKFHPSKKIPFPIDLVVEKMGIDIIPTSNLLRQYNIDGFLSQDQQSIYIDQDRYYNSEERYRFTIAHELGHFCLHKNFFEQNKFNDIITWKEIVKTAIDDINYSKLETQANMFASYILIPDYEFIMDFNQSLQLVTSSIQEAKEKKLTKNDYLETVIRIISSNLASKYKVSEGCMANRIKNDSLIDQIP